MMNRRELIRLATLSAGLQGLSSGAYSQVKPKGNPFKLGIASGSPTADGVVLWTKLVTDNLLGYSNAPIEVRFEVANDENFKSLVLQGTALALPQLDYSVHQELRGLQADRWYFYRFILGDAVSDVGRTRTAPALGSPADKLRFAFASCQHWEHGYYAAYRQMVADNPDLIVFLGDYIYESATPRKRTAGFVRFHDLPTATTLDDYRDRYAMHKSDPFLQAAHRAAPWIVTWDDHEVENDYANDLSKHLTPIPEFLARRAAAYQAFYEHMPLPASALTRGLAGLGSNDGVRVTQRLRWGQLTNFHVLDCRQYRDHQACPPPGKSGANVVQANQCPALFDPNRTLLGKPQEQWLAQGLGLDTLQGAASQAMPWSVIAQSTLYSQFDSLKGSEQRFWTDGWDGYAATRQRLSSEMARLGGNNADFHPVFIGGDVHHNVVATIKTDFNKPESKAIATEFCGTSMTSFSGFKQAEMDGLYGENPHVAYMNSEKRGYALCDVTPKLWTTTLMGVDDITRANSATRPIAKFAVERGNKTPVKA